MFIRTIQKSFVLPALFAASALVAAAQTPLLTSGATSVQLNSGFLSALGSLGVTTTAIAPAAITSGIAVFPVVGGAIDIANAKGEIIHGGGLQFSAGGTTVQVKSFVINSTGSTPVLTALVIENGNLIGRTTLFDLTPTNATLVPGPGFSAALSSGAAVTLDPTAAASLNSILGTSALKGGTAIGTATILGVAINGN